MLQSLISPALESVQVKVIVYPKGRGDDGFAILDKLVNTTMVVNSARLGENENWAFVIGSVSGERPRSQILGRSIYQNVSINNGLMSLFKVSDRDAGVENLKSVCKREENYVPDKIQMQYLPEKFEHMLSSGDKLQVEAKNQVSEQMRNHIFEEMKRCIRGVEEGSEESEEGSEEYLLVYEEMYKFLFLM